MTKRFCIALASLLLTVTQTDANWIFGVMDPYPGYGHPSYYFPPAVAAFYAGYGYPSLIPGTDYYTPTDPAFGHHGVGHEPGWHQHDYAAPAALIPPGWIIHLPGFGLQ